MQAGRNFVDSFESVKNNEFYRLLKDTIFGKAAAAALENVAFCQSSRRAWYRFAQFDVIQLYGRYAFNNGVTWIFTRLHHWKILF